MKAYRNASLRRVTKGGPDATIFAAEAPEGEIGDIQIVEQV